MNKYNVVGVMSGTSMDGLDIAHVTLQQNEQGKWDFTFNASITVPYEEKWRLRLSKLRHQNSLVFYKTDRFYGQYIGECIQKFLEDYNLEADLVSSHGHTVFHQPENNISVQIGDGNSIYATTGIPTVTNFRALDVILGGEGAPLVGLADQHMFGEFDMCLNLGGFANISCSSKQVAFDVTPCNIILNRIAREFDQEFDQDGAIAESGSIDYDLLSELNDIEYYTYEHPKSLGREWISSDFWPIVRSYDTPKEDKMKTLVDHIAAQVCNSIEELSDGDASSKRIYVTGGGAFNTALINHIQSHTDAEVIVPTAQIVEFKEALAFALLGVLRVNNQVNVLSSHTGSKKDSVSGSLYGDFSKLI